MVDLDARDAVLDIRAAGQTDFDAHDAVLDVRAAGLLDWMNEVRWVADTHRTDKGLAGKIGHIIWGKGLSNTIT